jgi:hypothetical protein
MRLMTWRALSISPYFEDLLDARAEMEHVAAAARLACQTYDGSEVGPSQ